MAADLGENVKIVLRSDSSVALGIGGRQGLGKLRRLETSYLWLQDVLTQKRLTVRKVKGTDNPADLGTKHLKFDDIEKHLSTVGFSFRRGRSDAVPGINMVMMEPGGSSTGAVLARSRTNPGIGAGLDYYCGYLAIGHRGRKLLVNHEDQR